MSGSFYSHFIQLKPTKIGMWLSRVSSEIIFRYAGLTEGMNVLEIGPGLGAFADVCIKRSIEYYAVEPNRQMADELEAKGVEVNRVIVPPLPEFNRTFDAVVMIQVLEHMDTMSSALQIVQQIWHVLKPGGKIIVCSPDYMNLRINFFDCDFSHNFVTTRRRLDELLFSAGFRTVSSCYLSGPISGFLCILLSAFVSRLPFGILSALFPDSKLLYRLYRLQLKFSRSVLIVGERVI